MLFQNNLSFFTGKDYLEETNNNTDFVNKVLLIQGDSGQFGIIIVNTKVYHSPHHVKFSFLKGPGSSPSQDGARRADDESSASGEDDRQTVL